MLKSLLTSLIISAFAIAAEAKPIVITAFPYIIVAPGNYQVSAPSVFNVGPGTNITIDVQVPGKVVLDLNGVGLIPYNLNIENNSIPPSDCIDVFAGSDITIENGSVGYGAMDRFSTGIYVNAAASGPYLEGDTNNPLHFTGNPPTGAGGSIGITINNVSFCTYWYAIILAGVSGATVKNCSMVAPEGPIVGIWDFASTYGNTYVNNTFNEVRNPFIVSASSRFPITSVQTRSVFATPTPTPVP
jgi:hypothetical protein